MAAIIREQKKVFSFGGQVQNEPEQWINNKWIIAIYEGRDDIISITKNEEHTRTYRVYLERDFAIKICKTYIGSWLGAKSLFDLYLNANDDDLNFRLELLETIWDYTIPIKII